MCTVTYIPTKKGVIITSNRDEATGRSSASPAVTENRDGLKLLYPKDSKAAGTWIAAKNNNEVVVLLNGAFKNHEKKTFYKESRGTVLLNIFNAKLPEQAFEEIDLQEIENFTLILYKSKSLLECRWDGKQKHTIKKDPNVAHIWSSVTLYNPQVSKKREKWFSSWLMEEREIDQQKAIDFHRSTGDGNLADNLVMHRDDGINTVSITSAFITSNGTYFNYQDLKAETDEMLMFPKKRSVLNALMNGLMVSLIIIKTKIASWEYWPMHVIYAPMYVYWFYLSFKANSLFFFSAANPTRKNAGFVMEKKSDSYAFLPQNYYPKTVLVKPENPITTLKLMLDEKLIRFPVIAKPDMGERGTGVQLISSLVDLDIYRQKSRVDFLVQEFVNLPEEVGIFYCRPPGQTNGQITGIVGKELLTVMGDGKSNIEMLIRKTGRHLLQFKKLKVEYGNQLYKILPIHEKLILSYYGNHCRGAKFVDFSGMITEELTQTINRLCKHLPEFYFGRLDIKFSRWEELNQGKNLSVIEINGAASEPTHMYDPKHSIFFAWREIKRHWDLLYQISITNSRTKSIPLMGITEGIKMLRSHSAHVKKINSPKQNYV